MNAAILARVDPEGAAGATFAFTTNLAGGGTSPPVLTADNRQMLGVILFGNNEMCRDFGETNSIT